MTSSDEMMRRSRKRRTDWPKEIGPRLRISASSAGYVTLYTLGITAFLLVVHPKFRLLWTGNPGPVTAVALAMNGLVFMTYLLFGSLGYRIIGDDIKAPRVLTWGFLFLIFVLAMIVLAWLEATGRIGPDGGSKPARTSDLLVGSIQNRG